MNIKDYLEDLDIKCYQYDNILNIKTKEDVEKIKKLWNKQDVVTYIKYNKKLYEISHWVIIDIKHSLIKKCIQVDSRTQTIEKPEDKYEVTIDKCEYFFERKHEMAVFEKGTIVEVYGKCGEVKNNFINGDKNILYLINMDGKNILHEAADVKCSPEFIDKSMPFTTIESLSVCGVRSKIKMKSRVYIFKGGEQLFGDVQWIGYDWEKTLKFGIDLNNAYYGEESTNGSFYGQELFRTKHQCGIIIEYYKVFPEVQTTEQVNCPVEKPIEKEPYHNGTNHKDPEEPINIDDSAKRLNQSPVATGYKAKDYTTIESLSICDASATIEMKSKIYIMKDGEKLCRHVQWIGFDENKKSRIIIDLDDEVSSNPSMNVPCSD